MKKLLIKVFLSISILFTAGFSMPNSNTQSGELVELDNATIHTQHKSYRSIISRDGKFAYVLNSSDNSISMYHILSNGMFEPLHPATVSTGLMPYRMIISPNNKFAYVTNRSSHSVSMYSINENTGELSPLHPATINTQTLPIDIAITPNGKWVYVANISSHSFSIYSVNNDGTLLLKTNQKAATVPFNPGTNNIINERIITAVGSFVISPNGQYAYVTDYYSHEVVQYRINRDSTFSTIAKFTNEKNPTEIAVSRDGNFVYVDNDGSNSISMYRADSSGRLSPLNPSTVATGDNSSSVSTGANPGSIIIESQFAYVANRDGKSISMYKVNSTGTLSPLNPATITTNNTPISIAKSPDKAFLYVTDMEEHNIMIYNVNKQNGQLSAKVSTYSAKTGKSPIDVKISHDERFAYVVNKDNDSVSMYRFESGELLPLNPVAIPTQNQPVGITISPNKEFVYVINQGSNTISMYNINDDTGQLSPLQTPTIATGKKPIDIKISHNGKFVYVTNSNDNSISMYSVNQGNGILSPLSVATQHVVRPAKIALSADDEVAYVTSYGDNKGGVRIFVYSIRADGVLSQISPVDLTNSYTNNWATNPPDIMVSNNNKFLYVAIDGSDRILNYRINNDGTLTKLNPKYIDTGSSPVRMVTTPNGNFLYTTDYDSNKISMYSVNQETGGLSPLENPTINTGRNPYGIAVSTSGHLICVTNYSDSTVQSYEINMTKNSK